MSFVPTSSPAFREVASQWISERWGRVWLLLPRMLLSPSTFVPMTKLRDRPCQVRKYDPEPPASTSWLDILLLLSILVWSDFFFWDRLSPNSLNWLWIFNLQPSKCWDYRCGPLFLAVSPRLLILLVWSLTYLVCILNTNNFFTPGLHPKPLSKNS